MAATAIAEQVVAGPYVAESGTQMTTVTFTAADATNGNEIVMTTGRTLVIVFNTHGSTAGTVTVTSSADPYGRTANVTAFSVAASAFAARIFTPVGWEQTLGGRNLLITGSATTMKILAIPL
jgi:hypothetical protein